MGVKRKEFAAIFIGCILMILASASTVWIILGIKKLERLMFIKVYHVNILNAMLPGGTVAGTIAFGTAADLIGRKITLLSISVPYAIAFILFQFAKSLTVMCIGRIIAGLAVGGTYTVLPLYIGEIADPPIRGAMGSMLTLSSLLGVLMSYVIAAFFTYTVFNVVAIVLSTIFFITFSCIGVESPYYYIRKKRHGEHSDITHYYEGNNGHKLLFFQELKILSCFRSAAWIKSLIMMSLMILIHHLSGVSMIPILLQYMASYLSARNLDVDYKTILLSSVGLEIVGTLSCTFLVDKLGRKPCLMMSAICIALFYAPIVILTAIRTTYMEVNEVPALTILFLVMFLVFFHSGIAPVPQILLGELFPLKFKMLAAAYIVSLQQVSVFVVTNYFQEISYFIGYTTVMFMFFGAMSLAPILIHFVVLETKGKCLHEIQMILENY